MKYFNKLLAICLLFTVATTATGQFKENQKQELSHTNVLDNGGFERGTARWTKSGSSTLVVTGTTPYEGVNSGVWDASATSETLTSNPKSVPAGWNGKACLGGFQYSWDTGTLGHIEFKIKNGGTDLITPVVLVPTEAGVWSHAVAAFPCGSSGTIAIQLETTDNADAIKLDKFWLGEDYRIGETNQVIIEAPQPIVGSVSNLTTNIGVEGGTTQRIGNRQLVEGSIQFTGVNTDGPVEINLRPGTTVDVANIPALNAPTAGTDRVKLHGSWHMIDRGSGTFHSGEVTYDIGDDKIYLVLGSSTTGPIIDTLNNRPITIAVDDVISWSFDVPITEWANTGTTNTVTLETQGWGINSSITAATDDSTMLGTGTDGSYQIVQKSSNDMVLANRGSTAQIPCDGANASTGLTCSTGNEILGIAFDQPYGGRFEVCFNGSSNYNVTAGQVTQNLKVRETANTDDTVLDDTVGDAITYGMEDPGTNVAGDQAWHICGYFNWPGISKRTIKLLEKTGVNPTLVANRINLATDNSGVTITVKALTQNFPQAIAYQDADATNRGFVNTDAQEFGGSKTFDAFTKAEGGLSIRQVSGGNTMSFFSYQQGSPCANTTTCAIVDVTGFGGNGSCLFLVTGNRGNSADMYTGQFITKHRSAGTFNRVATVFESKAAGVAGVDISASGGTITFTQNPAGSGGGSAAFQFSGWCEGTNDNVVWTPQ